MARLPIVPENWLDADQQGSGGSSASAGEDPQAAGPKNPIGPVEGYPETGKNAWRAANDDTIVAATNKYNSERNLLPGDAEYMTPKLMKAWQMRESGGSPEGSVPGEQAGGLAR